MHLLIMKNALILSKYYIYMIALKNCFTYKTHYILWKLMYKNFLLTIKQYGGKKGIVDKKKW
jgi:hypothetical protein